jgi:hypothetical protein
MPRPIVPAHQRQRAAEACNLCRETKKRCSGSAPCTQCVRRGLESQCFITYAPRGSRTRARAERAAAANSVTSTGRTSSISTQSVQQNIETEESYRPLSPSHSQQDDDKDSQADASSATNPRMLLNSRGERGKTYTSSHRQSLIGCQSTLEVLHRYHSYKLFVISSHNKLDHQPFLTMKRAIPCLRLNHQPLRHTTVRSTHN